MEKQQILNFENWNEAEQLAWKYYSEQSVSTLQAKNAWLFGSRARGDGRFNSDFDIALETFLCDDVDWLALCNDVKEHAPTLHKVDFLNLATVNETLRNRILKEGIQFHAAGS